MTDHRVQVTRAQVLAAQAIVRRNARRRWPTPLAVRKIASARVVSASRSYVPSAAKSPNITEIVMELTIWTRDFWSATAERVLMTAAQVLIAVLTADGFDLIAANWRDIGVMVGTAALLSLLKSVAANAATRTGPSLTNSEQVIPPLPQPEGSRRLDDNPL